jgi:hypothetical protein
MGNLKASTEQLRARNERKRSGAAGIHLDRRDRRVRTRQAQFARAMKDAA